MVVNSGQSPQKEKRLEATVMSFHRMILGIQWTNHISNAEFLRTIRALIFKIRNRQFKFLGHIIRKGDLEKMTPTGYNEAELDRGIQRRTYLNNLCKYMEEQVIRGMYKVYE